MVIQTKHREGSGHCYSEDNEENSNAGVPTVVCCWVLNPLSDSPKQNVVRNHKLNAIGSQHGQG